MIADRVAGGLGFIIAMAYLALTLQISSPASVPLAGSRFFPTVVGAALAIASLAMLVQSFVKVPTEESNEKPEATEVKTHEQSPMRLVVTVGLLFGYLVAFVPLGYIISTFLFILTVTMYLDSRHWVRNLIYACIFPLAVYLLFSQILRVPLPVGPLG